MVNYIVMNNLVYMYPNLYVALRILLTTHVSVATCYWRTYGFNIKPQSLTYVKFHDVSERLNSLANIATEHVLANQLNFDTLINNSAAKKERKVQF